MFRVPLSLAPFRRTASMLPAKLHMASHAQGRHAIKNDLIDEESLSGHRPSSYFPVKLGDVVQSYTVKVKLGFSRSSTTWLCTDQSGLFKALKISTASDATTREANVFKYLHDSSLGSELPGKYCVRQPETTFSITSSGQTHQCFVFEPLGPSLHEFALHRGAKGFHLDEVRFMIVYILVAIEFLHAHHVVYTDIKLDNIQIMLPDNAEEILRTLVTEEEKKPSHAKGSTVRTSREMIQEMLSFPILCDLGAAEFGQLCYDGLAQPLPYRAPEVILGASWNQKVDIWSLGVLLWELVTGERLFGQSSESDNIRLMIQYMGLPPSTLLERSSRNSGFFDTHGRWSHDEISLINLENRVDFDATFLPFFDFLRSMLNWDPDMLLPASQLLKHPWLNAN